jgi:hypothetical protein
MINGVIITRIWMVFFPERIRLNQIIQEEEIVANDVEEVKEVVAEEGGTPN